MDNCVCVGLRLPGKDVWFESLSEDELRDHWSQDDGSSLAEKAENLSQFEAKVAVDIKLVGFDGEGHMNFKLTRVRDRKIRVAHARVLSKYWHSG